MRLLRETFIGKNIAISNKQKTRWVIPIPPIFSFIKNPDETLNAIYSLVDISRSDNVSEIFLDHSELKEMDMGASVVLDVIAMNITKECSWIRFAGAFPNDQRLRQIIKSMGITKHLGVKGAEPSKEAEALFVRFPLHSGFRQFGSELGGEQHRERAASQLVKYLNDCLAKASHFHLSDEGQSQILKWAGEIITNAEEHSGERQWYVIGCMTPVVSKRDHAPDGAIVIGECQLTIFGFGASIFESLSSDKTPEGTRNPIESLASKHTRYFNAFEKYSVKDLWTLYALQDGVSRFSPGPGQNTRGKGTVEMIEAFQNLGKSLDENCVPEMTLISGSTQIYFNNRYHLKNENVQGGVRKIIAFNDKNSLDEKPDSNHVHSLAGHFPGTLLTFKFFLDDQYLSRTFEKAKNASDN